MSRDRLITELEKRTGLPSPAVGRLLDELVSLACEEAAAGFTIPGLCEIRLVEEDAPGDSGPEHNARGPKKLTMTPLPAAIKLAQRAESAATREAGVSPEAPGPERSAAEPAAAPTATPPASAAQALPLDEALPPGLYSFPCPTCGVLVDAVPSMAGAKADCPFCAKVLRVPPPDSAVVGSSAPSATGTPAPFFSFRCSHCGEEMEMRSNRVGAEVDCPFCGVKLRVPGQGEEARRSLSPRVSLNSARPGGGEPEEVLARLMHRTASPMLTPTAAADSAGSPRGR